MEDAGKKFINDPSLITGMIVVVLALTGALIFTVRYIAKMIKQVQDEHVADKQTMVEIISNNTVAVEAMKDALEANTSVTEEMQKKLTDLYIQQKINEAIKVKR